MTQNRIEVREAAHDWHEETDEQGVVWTDKPTPSFRPHYLRLVAANGRVLATSEVYANLSNAQRAVTVWKRAFRDVLNPIGRDGEYVRKVWHFDGEGRRLL
jgi:hypothetical protein